MNWYLTTLLLFRDSEAHTAHSVQSCHYLITADDHDRAYEKSMRLGNGLSKKDCRFGGLRDLLLVYDAPNENAELRWYQIEMAPAELEREVLQKERMHAFQGGQTNPSGWYVGDVVMYEVHDEGSHGEKILVWINSYLIKAKDAEAAYSKAVQIGKHQEDETGSHTCDGERAHWQFKGLADIIPIRDAPTDGALLWCDDIVAAEREDMIPKKSELGVFKWQDEQRRQREAQTD